MLQSLCPKILSSIAKDISEGCPLWAILRANEYLDVEDPIRRALVQRALLSPTIYQNHIPSQKILSHGFRLGDFNLNEVPLLHEQRTSQRYKMSSPKRNTMTSMMSYRRMILNRREKKLKFRSCNLTSGKTRSYHRLNWAETPSFSISRRRSYDLRMCMTSLALSSSSPTFRSG